MAKIWRPISSKTLSVKVIRVTGKETGIRDSSNKRTSKRERERERERVKDIEHYYYTRRHTHVWQVTFYSVPLDRRKTETKQLHSLPSLFQSIFFSTFLYLNSAPLSSLSLSIYFLLLYFVYSDLLLYLSSICAILLFSSCQLHLLWVDLVCLSMSSYLPFPLSTSVYL